MAVSKLGAGGSAVANLVLLALILSSQDFKFAEVPKQPDFRTQLLSPYCLVGTAKTVKKPSKDWWERGLTECISGSSWQDRVLVKSNDPNIDWRLMPDPGPRSMWDPINPKTKWQAE